MATDMIWNQQLARTNRVFHNLEEVGVHVTPTKLDMKPFQTTKKHPQISSCEPSLSTKTFCNLLIMPLLCTLLLSSHNASRPTKLYQVHAYLWFPLLLLEWTTLPCLPTISSWLLEWATLQIFTKPVHSNFFYLNVTSLPQNLLEQQVVDDDDEEEMMMSVDFNLDSIFLGLFLALGHLDV